MSCCDHALNRHKDPNLPADFPTFQEQMMNLPLEAFCCAARVSYSMAQNSFKVLRPSTPVPHWTELTSEQREAIAQKVRSIINGAVQPDGEFEQLMYDNVITLTVEA